MIMPNIHPKKEIQKARYETKKRQDMKMEKSNIHKKIS